MGLPNTCGLILHAKSAGAVGHLGEIDPDGVVGQEGLEHVRPLNETVVARIEVVLRAEVHGFADVLEAVAVEMIDLWHIALHVVHIDQGEGGAVDDVVGAEFRTELPDEGRLAHTHLAAESEDAARGTLAEYVGGRHGLPAVVGER